MKMFKGEVDLEGKYELNVTSDSFGVFDKCGKEVYWETVGLINIPSHWEKYQYDTKGRLIRSESGSGVWYNLRYDEKGNVVYYEDNEGNVIDERKELPKLTEEEKVILSNISHKYTHIRRDDNGDLYIQEGYHVYCFNMYKHTLKSIEKDTDYSIKELLENENVQR